MELNTGATAWMLMSASLVLLMTPALALFYGGMSRTKSVLNMMMSFGALALVAIIYPLWGWSMSYGGTDFLGIVANPFTQFGLGGTFDGAALDENGVPAWVGVAFQMTFAIITVALISGSLAERVRFEAWMLFVALWVTFAYFPMAHMVWGGEGALLSHGGLVANLFGADPIDFAGGTVVHINAGIAALVLCLLIGRRPSFGKKTMRPHNLPFVILGAAFLLFGWYGFNAGSAFTADALAGMAWVNTTVAAASAAMGWMIAERIRDGHATSLGVASGIVAGLVAITPAAGSVSPIGAIIMGLLVGAACAYAVSLKFRFGFDDSLDVVGVHLVGGLLGTVLIGFFATDGGLLYGGGISLLLVQIAVAIIAAIFSGLVTLAIALPIHMTLGWRVSPEAEAEGIDINEHRETAYDTSVLSARI